MRGYITKRGRGYRVEIHLGYGPDGKRIRHRKTLSTKKAAEKYLRTKLDELEAEGAIRVRTLESFHSLLIRWLEVCASKRVREKTLEHYQGSVRRYVADHAIGRQSFSSITPTDIQALYSEMQERGVGPHGVRKLHAVIRQALDQAVKWREIPANPALSVDLPKAKKNKEMKLIAPADFPKFVAAALEEKRNGVLWVLALSTGMRPEEYLGLTWSDFHKGFQKFTINRVLVRPVKVKEGKPHWRFEAPKTKRSRRTLAIDPQLAKLLRVHRAVQNQEKLKAGPAYDDHGLVFANELGGPLYLANLRNRELKRILKRAGFDQKITPYCLRHSAATSLLKDRESLKVVSSVLGHASIRLTADVYSHVTDDMLEEAAGKLGKRMFGGT
ncbi:MAG: site-specific integrase [Vulcanimicrobiota bacterium]